MHFGHDFGEFFKKNPAKTLVIFLLMVLLAGFELIEFIPGFRPVTDSTVFPYIHESHDILALGLALYVAYRWDVSVGMAAIAFFFVIHLPYFALRFPAEIPELVKMSVTVVGSMFGVALISVLKRTIRLASLKQGQAEQAEDALRHSAAELRAIFSAMTEVILVFDGWGYCHEIAATRPKAPVYNYHAFWVGKKIEEVLPGHVAAGLLESIHYALDSGRAVTNRYKVTIEGRETAFEVAISPFEENKVVWVARDVAPSEDGSAKQPVSEQPVS